MFLDEMSTDEAPRSLEWLCAKLTRENAGLRADVERYRRRAARVKYLKYYIKTLKRSREKMRARFFKLFDVHYGLDFSGG